MEYLFNFLLALHVLSNSVLLGSMFMFLLVCKADCRAVPVHSFTLSFSLLYFVSFTTGLWLVIEVGFSKREVIMLTGFLLSFGSFTTMVSVRKPKSIFYSRLCALSFLSYLTTFLLTYLLR
ncbi:hypothetical protein [Hydrogenivirga caldilitoris]|uniref:hypothetical protein n=1 Tax=Hydrogenivirga caldilitoris TaxID=246264 RepID=UPI000EB35D8C|nr:hypothetical protein [Hydrogenivirga caldilitoris]